ncbi:MAG: U32 family peptidase [Betaproteobacteria bacterium]|nr:U32 family peptidase [Betaproteobacteria bacterium]
MNTESRRIAIAPIPYPWGRARVQAFYEEAATWPVDIVCLGESVCAKRSALAPREWLDLARRLEGSGREVVFASPPGLETPGELHLYASLADEGRFAVEVNDVGLFPRLRGKAPIVAGPHLHVYNAATLRTLIRWGAYRWVAPYEIDAPTLAELAAGLPSCLETEAFVLGAIPLAYSPRCFTAARRGRTRKDCGQACLDAPAGEALESLEGEELFVQDGKQTLSARPVSLLSELARLVSAGATVLRLQPAARGTGEVVRLVREALAGRMEAGAAQDAAELALGRRTTNGFWHGGAGMERVVAPLWSPRRP